MGARGRTIAYVPALDGLRGLAVGGVLAFHAGVGLPGGFIGVSVFFTLSGYLITTLLLAEHETQGRVSLAGFYSRRARRLLPASLTCLIAVTLAGPWWSATQQDHLPGDVWAALANVANWRFAVAEHSYAELFRADPSPVAHYWSLAIEEQLYLLLPLVVVLCLCRSRRTLLAVTAGLVALSLAATVTASDLNLAYHGTHTRGAELLIGALLAQVGVDRLVRRGGSDLLGAAALAGLILAMATTHVEDRWLYRGGWVAIGLASAAVICAASSGGVVARRLSAPRLVAFGRISYGVYLYHWPLFLLLDEGRTGLSGWPLVAVRIAATMAVATASSRWIELPVRNGRLRGPRLAWPLAASGVAVAVLAPIGHGQRGLSGGVAQDVAIEVGAGEHHHQRPLHQLCRPVGDRRG